MNLRNKYQITEYCHRFLSEYISEGDICIDGTAGNGNDTEFLCRLVGEAGKVYAFDIQEQAIANTREKLAGAGLLDRAEMICDGHERMEQYVTGEVTAVVFNLGYLPGGDHAFATRAETSLEAVKAGMRLLKPGGVISLCIYSGGDTGYEERDVLLGWLKDVDPKKWLVIVNNYYNRRNDPPLPVFILRLD